MSDLNHINRIREMLINYTILETYVKKAVVL